MTERPQQQSTRMLKTYDETLDDLTTTINSDILALRKASSSSEREKLINSITISLEKSQKCFKRFKREMKKLTLTDKDHWDKQKRSHADKLNKLSVQFTQARDSANRSELLSGADKPDEEKDVDASPTTGAATGEEKPAGRSRRRKGNVEVRQVNGKKIVKDDEMAEDLFADIFKVQDESLAIVDRLLRKADEAHDIATETQEQLKSQTEQLERVNTKLDELFANIKRAGLEIMYFMRRTATDKLFLVVCAGVTCVVFLSLIMAIVCKVGVCKLVFDLVNKWRGKDKKEEKTNGVATTLAIYVFESAMRLLFSSKCSAVAMEE